MKTVFMYAGQGSQKVSMGKDFYDEYESFKYFIDRLDLSFDHKSIMFESGIENLSETKYTQPCMAAFAAGLTDLLSENGIKPDMSFGLSLGEYGALYASGVYDADTYVKITQFRGQVMQDAAGSRKCAMSAILKTDRNNIEKTIEEYDGEGYVIISNYNCPGQYVICGDETAVTNVEDTLRNRFNSKNVRLNVSGPFHTRFMAPAAKKMRDYYKNIQFNKPKINVAMNYTGKLLDEDEDIKELLINQVKSPIKVEDDIITMLNNGAERFIEIGPGKVLSGFVKKTARVLDKTVDIISIESVSDFKNLVKGNSYE